jgi:hypothetical protein
MNLENKKLWLNEAMLQFEKKLHKGKLNIINSSAGSGKSTFIFREFLNESYKYVEGLKKTKKIYKANLNKVLYICDTNMLKSSILQENQDITKILEKDDLKEAMTSKTFDDLLKNNTGHIKVITYSTLGWLLKQSGSQYIILNYLEVLILDEMQNLFKYANRFDTEENGQVYTTVIKYLPSLVNNMLVVALSATTGRIHSGLREMGVNTNTIFNYDELKEIRKYKEEMKIPCKFLINEVKRIGLAKDFLDKHNYKVFIYTNTIKVSEKYKQQLERYGLKAEWLCSINNTIMNEDGEIIPKMNESQLSIREQLIKYGTLPDDLDVIIVNSGYETGWNLRDERVQVALIDSNDIGTQIQARNRIRHDIVLLTVTEMTDDDGTILEYDQYRNIHRTDNAVSNSFLPIELDEKYLGVKLSNEDKKYLVDRYAIIHLDKQEANWKTFKKDLEMYDYIVDTTNKGTFIYTKEQYNSLKSKKDVNALNEKFINWINTEWDKKRITCQDVMDMLDIGRKSFDKLITDADIENYLKDNRYKIGTIKGSKTKYLFKY